MHINAYPRLLKEDLERAVSLAVKEDESNSGFDPTTALTGMETAEELNNLPQKKIKRDFTRERKLPRKTLINLLLSMQGGSLNKELHEAGIDVTASAFSQQRKKLSWKVMESVFRNFNEITKDNDTNKINGYKIYAVDGTSLRIARDSNAETFIPYGEDGKGYNALHINAMYDVLNKVYVHVEIDPQPQQDEVGALYTMLVYEDYPDPTLIVADRGYESYNMFAAFMEETKKGVKKVDFLIRVKQNKSAMREIAKLSMNECDTDISFTITTSQKREDREKNYILIQTQKDDTRIYSTKTRKGRWEFGSPYPMSFRVVRFQLITGEFETLATSLPRETFTLEQIKELYHSRWGIETAFRELKYGIGLINQHGKGDVVKQEVYSALTLSNFCSRIVNQILIKRKTSNEYAYAVNMKMAIYLCRNFLRSKGTDADAEKLIRAIDKYTEPVRPGRQDERKIKSKPFVGFTYRVLA